MKESSFLFNDILMFNIQYLHLISMMNKIKPRKDMEQESRDSVINIQLNVPKVSDSNLANTKFSIINYFF